MLCWPWYFLVITKYDIWYLLFEGRHGWIGLDISWKIQNMIFDICYVGVGMDELALIFPGKYKIWYLVSVIWGRHGDELALIFPGNYKIWYLISVMVREWSGHVTWILGSYWPKRFSPNFYFQIIIRNILHISSNYQEYWAYFQ